jgi:hypothetical protein
MAPKPGLRHREGSEYKSPSQTLLDTFKRVMLKEGGIRHRLPSTPYVAGSGNWTKWTASVIAGFSPPMHGVGGGDQVHP